MCGIAGIYRFKGRPIYPWQLKMLATELQYRGDDATGIALISEDGQIAIHKNNDPAWRFCARQDFERFCSEHLNVHTRIALVHTRKWTTGSPIHNENNHPIYAGQGVIIHNGMVSNHKSLFEANKAIMKPSCETDSDIFRGLLDSHGKVDTELIKYMGLVDGSAAVAAYHPGSPDKLLLLRDSNPIVLGATPDMLMFASDKTAIHKAIKPWVKLHNIPMQVHAPDLSFVPMPNETGWIIGPQGLEDHAEFKCNGVMGRGNTKYSFNTLYDERRARAEREASKKTTITNTTVTSTNEEDTSFKIGTADDSDMPDWVICPNPPCSKHLSLSEEDKKLESLGDLLCGSCRTNLAEAIQTVVTH